MLSLEMQLKITRQASSYGETGRHVHGRGIERTDGTFSDETPPQEVKDTLVKKPQKPTGPK